MHSYNVVFDLVVSISVSHLAVKKNNFHRCENNLSITTAVIIIKTTIIMVVIIMIIIIMITYSNIPGCTLDLDRMPSPLDQYTAFIDRG